LAAGPNLPMAKDSAPLSAGGGDASSPEQPSGAASQPEAKPPAALKKTPLVALQAGLGLPEPGATPGGANRQAGQTATAALATRAAHLPDRQGREVSVAPGRSLPLPAQSVPLSAGSGEATDTSAAASPKHPSGVALHPGGPVPAASETTPPGVAPGVANRQEGQTATVAAGRDLPLAADSVPLSGGDGKPRTSAAPSPEHPSSVAPQPGGPVPAAAVKPAGVEWAVGGEPAVPPASQPQAVRRAPQPGAELPAAVAEMLVATEKVPASPVAGKAERAAHQQDGRSAASPLTTPPAVTALRTGDTLSDPQEQGTKAPALARRPARMDAQTNAGWALGVAADRQDPRPAGVASVEPPAAEKAAALASAQPGAPPARSEDPDLAVPADETATHAAMPAPVWLPPASADPTNFSVRRSAGTQASASPPRRSSFGAVAQVLALSGQAPRTVDSIPPAEPSPQPVERVPGPSPHAPQSAAAGPVKAAPQSLAETPVPAADTQVRVLAPSTPDRDEVAFAVQMKAMAAPEDRAPREAAVTPPEADGPRRIPVAGPQRDLPAAELAAASDDRPSESREPDQAPARAGRERRLDAVPVERVEAPAGATAGKIVAHAAPDAQVKTETSPEKTDTTAVRPQDAMESETRPEAAKAPPVRDMKFEVTGGERRVEVRLSERGGEVKMTVRTPDPQLAGTLRENLPTLSARLAESGFKSEAWHPAASSPNERRHTTEPSAGGASQDANTPSHQQDRESQDGAGQRRPRSPQETAPQKEKGKDFAWLMSTLR
jgi:hypothetical protein